MTFSTSLKPTELEFLQSSLINIPHGTFNRLYGISVSPYSSLNVSFGVGDKPENVAGNRQLVKKALHIPHLLSAGQIHGDRVYCSAGIVADLEIQGYDALITDQPGVGLLVQQADCQAILMYDPHAQVIAAIHCGWRGSTLNIIRTTIQEMQKRYHVRPENLLALISPSLGPCCSEFINYREELPESLHHFQALPNHFNFWDISLYQLTKAGVLSEHIDIAEVCTVCDRNYFSYRRAKSQGKACTGRNGSLIYMPERIK